MTDRAVLYARVSTHRQDETQQIPVLRRMAAQRGYEIVLEVSDEASGRDGNRPGWQKVLALARKGGCDVVMAVKIDRVMRSLTDLYAAMSALAKSGVRLETGDYTQDPNEPAGRMMLGFLGLLAEWERGVIGERTKAALAERKRRGVTLGRPQRALPTHRIALMRKNGMAWGAISKTLDIPESTLRSRRKEIEDEMERL